MQPICPGGNVSDGSLSVEVVFAGELAEGGYIFVPIGLDVRPKMALGESLAYLFGSAYLVKHAEALGVGGLEDGLVRPQAGDLLGYDKLDGSERCLGIVCDMYLYALYLLILHRGVEGLGVDGAEDDAGHVEGVERLRQTHGINPRGGKHLERYRIANAYVHIAEFAQDAADRVCDGGDRLRDMGR